MTDARVLLERHKPRIVYDALETYFADSAAIWTDSPHNTLRRADGTVLAKPPKLRLEFLGPHSYEDKRPVLADDVIGETTRSYAAHASALHREASYRDRVYGHAKRDRHGRLWLQYWLFYSSNDFQLLGPLFSGGKHEGDWELVQFRLGPSEQPEQAVYTQHKLAESRPWTDVRKAGTNTPIVYVARGSHANYFRMGSHWTGVWWDQADGRGPQITPTLEVLEDRTPAWVHWPGWWGDTKATASPVDSASPRSPGRRPHWNDPSLLVTPPRRLAPATATLQPPPSPSVIARREGDRVILKAEGPGPMVVGARESPSDPARTWRFEDTQAMIETAAEEIWVSVRSSAAERVVVRSR